MQNKIFLFLLILSFIFLSFADVPMTVNYQGKLFDSGTGGPIDGTRAIGYKLYEDTDDDGWEDTDPVVWSKTPANVSISDGLFSDKLDFTGSISIFNTTHNLYLEVYVGPEDATTFSECTALSSPEQFRSTPYAFYAQNAISSANLQSGTSANQTLRWDGSQWVPSDALTNDGTDISTTGNLTVGNDLTVSGNDISGGASGQLYIRSNGSVRVDLDDDGGDSESFKIVNNSNNIVFEVTEAGNVDAEGNATFDGNLTLSGDSRYISSGDALDIRGNSGIDVYIDYDESGTGSQFYVKTLSSGSDVNLFRVDEDGDAQVYRKLNIVPQSSEPSGAAGDLYVKQVGSAADTLKFYDGSSWRAVAVGDVANSLQGAYDGGNTIDVNSSNSVEIYNGGDATTPLVVTSSVGGNEAAYFGNSASGNAIKTGGGSNSGNIWMETGNLTVDAGNITVDGYIYARDGSSNKFSVDGNTGNTWTAGNIYMENSYSIYAKDAGGTDRKILTLLDGSNHTLFDLYGNDMYIRDQSGNNIIQFSGGTDQLIWAWGSIVDADSATNNLGSNANPFANLYLDNQVVWEKGSNDGVLQVASLSATRTWTLPDATGTIALTNNTDNYQYWTASDGSNNTNITSTSTLTYSGSGGITTSLSGNTLTIDGSGISGSQWTDAGNYLRPSDDANELTKIYETAEPTYRVRGYSRVTTGDYAFGDLGYYGTAIGGTSRHIGVYGNSGSGTDNVAVAGRYSSGRYGYIAGQRYAIYGKFDEDATGLTSTMAGYFINDDDENNSSYSKFGVYGDVTADYGTKYAIYGSSEGDGTNYGVYGKAFNGATNYGGYFDGTTYGVYGKSTNWAGYFDGNGYFSGNVGIGASSPQAELDVNGTIRANNYRDNGGGDLIRSSDGSINVSEDADGSWNLIVAGGSSSGNFGINVETLTADKTLQVGTDEMYQYLDPNGANRNITLSTSGASAGDRFIIRNNGSYNSDDALITYQGGNQLDWIYAGGIKEFIFDGTNWVSASNGTGENDDKKYSVSLGYGTKAYTHGTAIGYSAQGFSYGTGIGEYADGHNHGVAVGRYADADAYGVAVGDHADGHSSGVAIGYYTGDGITSGSGNILIGYQAGDNITTGSKNILVGYNIDTPDATTNNFLSIGNLIFATAVDGEGTTVSSGKVGIGTPDPSYKLEVAGDAGFDDYLYHNDDDNTYIYFTPDRIQFYTGGRSMIDVQYSDNEVAINEGGTQTDFRVEGGSDDHLLFTDGSTDRVGIGTTSPSYKLDVAGDAYIQDDLIIDINGNGWGFRSPFGSSAEINFRPSSGSGNFQVGSVSGRNGVITFGGAYWYDAASVSGDPTPPSYDAGSIYGVYPTSSGIRWYNGSSWQTITPGGGGTPGGSDGQIQYNNGGSFGGAADFYYDDANDRVGIGTSSPSYKLDVHESTNSMPAIVGTATGDNSIGVGGYSQGTSGDCYGIYGLANGSGATTNYGVYGTASNGGTNWAGYFDGNGYFSGNVGIGATSPSYKLDVSGTGRFSGDLTAASNLTIGNMLNATATWGENARTQGICIIPEGTVSDDGSGNLTFGSTVIVMNPAAGSWIRVASGTYTLGTWGYLYVDIPPTGTRGTTVTPSVGTWTDGDRNYDNRDRIILAQRMGNGAIFTRFTQPANAPTGDVPTNAVYWIDAGTYIYPEDNASAKVYDSGETYGYYYDGSSNQFAGYFSSSASNNAGCVGSRTSTLPTIANSDVFPYNTTDGMTKTGVLGVGDLYMGVTGHAIWDAGVRGIGIDNIDGTYGTNSAWPICGVIGEVIGDGTDDYGQQGVIGWQAAPAGNANYCHGVYGRTSQTGYMSAGVVGQYNDNVGTLVSGYENGTTWGALGLDDGGGLGVQLANAGDSYTTLTDGAGLIGNSINCGVFGYGIDNGTADDPSNGGYFMTDDPDGSSAGVVGDQGSGGWGVYSFGPMNVHESSDPEIDFYEEGTDTWGGIRWNGSNMQYSDDGALSTWTNFGSGGGGLWTDDGTYIYPNNVGSGWQIQDDGDLDVSGSYIYFGSAEYVRDAGANLIEVGGHLRTMTDNSYDLGDASIAWRDLYIDGGIVIDGGRGSSGQVLKSDGTNVYWGTDATGGGGDNLGNHSATQNLDMNEYDINEVDDLNGNDYIYICYSSSGSGGTRVNNDLACWYDLSVDGSATLGDATSDIHYFWGYFQSGSESDDHRVVSNSDNYGYVGFSGRDWWYGYAVSWTSTSNREEKRDIHYLTDADYELVMNDIDNTPLAWYKFKCETDELEEDNEAKYRPMYHLGTFTDEAPDYVQDNTFSGISLYEYSSMALAGVKYLRKETQELEAKVERLEGNFTQSINDFGTATMEGNEMWVLFSDEFASQLGDNVPVVTVTPNCPGVVLCITEKTNKGFKVMTVSGSSPFSFDWIAMAKAEAVREEVETEIKKQVSPEILSQLRVPDEKKQLMRDWARKENEWLDSMNAIASEQNDITTKSDSLDKIRYELRKNPEEYYRLYEKEPDDKVYYDEYGAQIPPEWVDELREAGVPMFTYEEMMKMRKQRYLEMAKEKQKLEEMKEKIKNEENKLPNEEKPNEK